MAYYADFNSGSATFSTVTFSSEFNITFKYRFTDNDELVIGHGGNNDSWVGSIAGELKLKIGQTVYSTGLTISSGLLAEVSIVRDASNLVIVLLNGNEYQAVMAGDLWVNKIGGNSIVDYASANGHLYYLNLAPARTYVPTSSSIENTFDNSTLTTSGGVDYIFYEEEVPDPSSVTINNPPKLNHVYQRDGNDEKQISFGVTYTGTPSSLEYRLLDDSSGAVIQDWTVFDNSPTAEAATLTFTRQKGLTPLTVEVRHGNDTAITSAQTNRWYVGDNILIFGQSLAEDMNTDGSVTPLDGYFYYDGSSSSQPTTGGGSKSIAESIILADSCAVCVTNTAVGGTPLASESGEVDYWDSAGGSLWTTTVSRVNGMTAGDNRLAFAWWHQGTRDSIANVTEAEYLSAMQSFFTRVRSTFSGAIAGNLKLMIATLGRDTRGTTTALKHQAIRNAQISYLSSASDTYAVNSYPYATEDGVHAVDSSYVEIGKEISAHYFYSKGDIANPSLSVSNVTQAAGSGEITVTFNTPLDSSVTNYATEGVRVEDGEGLKTVSSFARVGSNTAKITANTALTGNVQVWLSYGIGETQNLLTKPKGSDITLPSGDLVNMLYSAPLVSSFTVSEGAINTAPTAIITGNTTGQVGTEQSFSASASTDPENDALTYSWALTVPSGSSTTLTNATGVSTAYTPDIAGNYSLELTVSDGELSDADTLVTVVGEAPNTPPTANAGTNQTLAADIQGQLNGSGTVTTAGAAITGYQWVAPAGITLVGANTANPTFTTPQLNVATTFTFSLVVTDSNGLTSVADTVDIIVEAYSPPVVSESELLAEIAKTKFTLSKEKVFYAFSGRGNLDELKFKLNSTNQKIALDNEGCFDFSENDITKVSVIADSGEIDSSTSAVTWEGSSLFIQFGAFSSPPQRSSIRIVVYVGNDDKGIVIAGAGLPANIIVTFQ